MSEKSSKLNIVVEDFLSETVARKLIREFGGRYEVSQCFGKKGFPFIKANLQAFNNSSRINPYLILTDLDDKRCAPSLKKDWFTFEKSKSLLFRVAVKEVETWLLADRMSFSKYFGVSEREIPEKVETIIDPKKFVTDLAKKSKKQKLKEAVAPREGSTVKVGPDYNGAMSLYVEKHWKPETASRFSNSLKRAIGCLKSFHGTDH